MYTTGFATLYPGTRQVYPQSDAANTEQLMDTADSGIGCQAGSKTDGEKVNLFWLGDKSKNAMETTADSDAVNPLAPYVADMTVCEERLKTFDEWPKYMKPTAPELAKAGFYYTGMGDRVMCFSCKVVLKNWEPTDTAWGEHARWRPSCNYLKTAYCKPKSVFATPYRNYDTCDSNRRTNVNSWTTGF